jgi:hypothetical protein
MREIITVVNVERAEKWDRIIMRRADNTIIETLLTDPRLFRRIRPLDMYQIEVAPLHYPNEIKIIERVFGEEDVKITL